MKRLIILFLCFQSIAYGQKNTLPLDSCIRMAKRNYPLIKQNNLLSESEHNAIRIANKNWLPKFSFISKVTYQTEVVEFSGIAFPKDNYITALDLEQTVFDAGQTRQQKKLDRLNSENEIQKNEIEMYKLIDRVNQIYSSILMIRENINLLNLYKSDISNKKSILTTSVYNGLTLQSNLDELEAEEIKTEQAIDESKGNLSGLYETMALYLNAKINDSTLLSTDPVPGISSGNEITRPELKLFENQKQMLDIRHKITGRNALPKLTLTAQGAYGRPGPDFLNQDLRFFGQGAINLKWNLNGLYTLHNDRQNSVINQKLIDNQKEVFEFNIKTTLAEGTAKINALKEILAKDKLIIEKRKNVTRVASSQLDNGTITLTDYLIQLNAGFQAELNQKVHEIKLMNAISNYNTTKGVTNF